MGNRAGQRQQRPHASVLGLQGPQPPRPAGCLAACAGRPDRVEHVFPDRPPPVSTVLPTIQRAVCVALPPAWPSLQGWLAFCQGVPRACRAGQLTALRCRRCAAPQAAALPLPPLPRPPADWATFYPMRLVLFPVLLPFFWREMTVRGAAGCRRLLAAAAFTCFAFLPNLLPDPRPACPGCRAAHTHGGKLQP